MGSPTQFTGPAVASPLGPFSSQTIQETELGALMFTGGGRVFRYCLVGASALVPGKMFQAPAQITDHQNLTPAAAAIGATTITAALNGTTVATANQYAGGWVMVTVTPGQGQMLRISSNSAAGAAGTITLTLDDPLVTAITTSSRLDLVLNPYSGVILALHTSQSAMPTGSGVSAAAAASYAWLQTGGPTCLLAEGTVTVDTLLGQSVTTDGAVTAFTGVIPAVGFAMTGIATTEYGAVFLNID